MSLFFPSCYIVHFIKSEEFQFERMELFFEEKELLRLSPLLP